MSDPFWRPARFLNVEVPPDGSDDAVYTINPGDIGVITSITGVLVGDGITDNCMWTVSAAGIIVFREINANPTPEPVAVLNPFIPVFPGEAIVINGQGGVFPGAGYFQVCGRLYAATQLAP